MIPSTTARRYAEAAYQVAGEDGDTETWLRDLRTVAGALADRNYALYFKDPSISEEEKQATLERAFGRFPPHVLNLLRVLVARHRMHLVPQVLRELEDIDRQAKGIAQATVTTARPVTEEEKDGIARRLAEVTGKRVELRTETDPSILGGIVVRIGDQLIDASVAGRLERLRQQLA